LAAKFGFGGNGIHGGDVRWPHGKRRSGHRGRR
jgi:hypothetical protein